MVIRKVGISLAQKRIRERRDDARTLPNEGKNRGLKRTRARNDAQNSQPTGGHLACECNIADVKPVIWTPRRKLMGNLIPALVWLPFFTYGLSIAIQTGELLGSALVWMAIGSLLGWVALNYFGLFQNRIMRVQLERNLRFRNEPFSSAHWFVGFSSPRYTGLLDAHEDVGYLFLLPDKLRFVGEDRVVMVWRNDVKAIRFRPNVHTFLGLGRWVSVEGVSDGQPFRLLVEPRVRNTMIGNFRRSKNLRRDLLAWFGSGPKVT